MREMVDDRETVLDQGLLRLRIGKFVQEDLI